MDGDLRLWDGGARTQGVIFDLFETLIDYDEDRSREFTTAAADLLGRDREEFHGLWRKGREVRDSGPLAPYVASLGLADDVAEQLLELRRATARRLLVPRSGVVETLRVLRQRGLKVGLITVCSEDTVDVWSESPFAGLFDVEIFSCSVQLRKPDPRIYLLACHELGIEPADAIFVGDGANDELAGAERAGMRAVMIGGAIEAWPGARISAIPEVLDLL
jgi:putative hydrolase of the HAD superfamily